MKKVMLAVVSVSVLALSSVAFAGQQSETIYLAAAIGSGASTTGGMTSTASSGAMAATTAAGATANMVAVGVIAASGIAVASEAGSTTSH